ncbi:hypothetical protein GCM10010174_74170 [Kutzneria viridogrisea]|uniref:Uncharacterized protein n=1 Tax=Kutzneria viridogrisea TaxID=47990 RepID=A0ABR6BLS5_9PSEU|nr:hypothetical protein [Kutzneria albida]MBA8927852.1 hypothetical protein [Kutzneria viridogrisea]
MRQNQLRGNGFPVVIAHHATGRPGQARDALDLVAGELHQWDRVLVGAHPQALIGRLLAR